MGKKYYAVKKGRKVGIYKSWGKCKKQVEKFPGAVFKGFASRIEAEQFLNLGSNTGNLCSAGNERKKSAKEDLKDVLASFSKNDTLCFTDGSCFKNPGPCGAAAVVFFPKCGLVQESKVALGHGTNNIGELFAIHIALDIVKKQKDLLPSNGTIRMITDSKYTKGVLSEGWNATKNPELVAWIRDELSDLHRQHPITFHWVKGHAGVEENERADLLANQAAKQSKKKIINFDVTIPPQTPLLIVESPLSKRSLSESPISKSILPSRKRTAHEADLTFPAPVAKKRTFPLPSFQKKKKTFSLPESKPSSQTVSLTDTVLQFIRQHSQHDGVSREEIQQHIQSQIDRILTKSKNECKIYQFEDSKRYFSM